MLFVCLGSASGRATEIVDIVKGPDNIPFTGSVAVATTGPSGSEIPVATAQITDGALDLELAPNASQAQVRLYKVHFQSSDDSGFTQFWTVPPSDVPLRIDNVKLPALDEASVAKPVTSRAVPRASTSSISESSVTGLMADLAARPTASVGFATNAAVATDDQGVLTTVVGDPGTCVYVDGTTGPCALFSDSETPGGAVDGTNTTFTLANTPSGQSLLLFRNGLCQSIGQDYNLVSSPSGVVSIQFINGVVPSPGDVLVGYYRIFP